MFTGQVVEIIVGFDGFTGTKNLSEITPQNLIKAIGVSFSDGAIRKEGGAAKYNSTALTGSPEILGGWDWWPDTNTQRLVVLTDDGDLLKDDGTFAFATALASSLSTTGVVPVFVEGGKEVAANDRKLFLFTGLNAVQVLAADGATASALSTPPTDWSLSNQPTFGFIHEGRLMGGGNSNDPHRIYYSSASDHEDFTTGGTISVYPGEGEKLVAGISFKGLAVLWKYPKGIYAIDTSDPTPANWRVTKISREIGGAGPRCFCMIDDDIIFCDTQANLHLISTIQEFGNLGSRNVSQLAGIDTFLKDQINFAAVTKARLIYHTARREVHALLPSSGQTTLDRRLTVDLNRIDFYRFRWNERDTNTDIWLNKNSDGTIKPYIGDDAGFVWKLDQSIKSQDGEGFDSRFQTPHLDFSYLNPKLATVKKNGKFLELVVEPKGNWSLSADIYWDGVYAETVLFNMGQVGASLDSFTLDSDVLSVDQIINRKKKITGSGRRFSVEFYNSGANEDFSISKCYLHFKPGSEKHD